MAAKLFKVVQCTDCGEDSGLSHLDVAMLESADDQEALRKEMELCFSPTECCNAEYKIVDRAGEQIEELLSAEGV